MSKFGANLRRRARSLGLTDAEVARRSGLNERRYGFYVTGEREPDLATLLRIADVLQSSVDDLLSERIVKAKPASREDALLSAAHELDDAHFTLLVTTAEAFAKHQRGK
jgi:transcriptional regulator with XRE-family HTH domain